MKEEIAMRKKIIVWSSIICLVVLLVVISSIWQYNDKKPKYKYYINDENIHQKDVIMHFILMMVLFLMRL